jgi:AraC-like DNA-binding protein
MIAGFDNTLFVKHESEKGYMHTNTPFMEASIHYHQLQEGLWVMMSYADYKANINFKRMVDREHPSDFYVLSLEIARKSLRKSEVMINGLTYSVISWILFKPEASNENCFLKGVKQDALMIFFNESYLNEILSKTPSYAVSPLKAFFESKHKIVTWPEKEDIANRLADPVIQILENKKKGKPSDAGGLESYIDKLFQRFIEAYDSSKVGSGFSELSGDSQKKMLKAEKLIMEQIGQPFLGIELLAQKVGVSKSALKANFKIMFGESVYQYFRSHQLLYAWELLQTNAIPVKEVGLQLGYQSASKFSAAFKKQFGMPPSEINKSA